MKRGLNSATVGWARVITENKDYAPRKTGGTVKAGRSRAQTSQCKDLKYLTHPAPAEYNLILNTSSVHPTIPSSNRDSESRKLFAAVVPRPQIGPAFSVVCSSTIARVVPHLFFPSETPSLQWSLRFLDVNLDCVSRPSVRALVRRHQFKICPLKIESIGRFLVKSSFHQDFDTLYLSVPIQQS
ncbi:hypothetical protein V2J09_016860 [Rumex salicifolius]